ncbi:MAG: 16S rRNA (uracil(1498)-N(3))-methyltransferase [Armatimonadetes bacterium]|nr:16S rRNA (uracil(1498)-N(3))-methyltransferase [Armatimonadota bacterium]
MNHRRFFIDPSLIDGDTAVITGTAARQIARILRLKSGDTICLIDGRGNESDAQIVDLSAGIVTARILGSRKCESEPKLRLALAVCLPKGDKIELIVQKCTELGISELIIVSSRRTVARVPVEKIQAKLTRWRKIAIEATEQCGRAVAPDVEGILGISDLAELVATFQFAFVACEKRDAPALRDVLRGNSSQFRSHNMGGNNTCLLAKEEKGGIPSAMIIIGPEGGLTEEETALLVQAGAIPVSLGRRVLRTETAAIAACAVVMYEIDGEL